MTDDVSERLSEIRERARAHVNGDEVEVQIRALPKTDDAGPAIRFHRHARSDVPYLLSLVEAMRDQLCKYTCDCERGPASNTDPEAHADYCLYRSALRDAAQEGAE